MANIDYLRKRVQRAVKDVYMTDTELNELIRDVLDDLSVRTRLFKKLFGFTIHKEINQYNFRYLARLNEEVEQEPSAIMLQDPSNEEIVKFILTGVLPDIPVEKTLEQESAKSRLIDLLDVYNEYGKSVIDKFHERGSTYYFVSDEGWLVENDGKQFAFTGWVVPDLDELHEEDLRIVSPALVAGAKFFIMDRLHSGQDVQTTNYDFLRYHQALEELQDRFPTTSYGFQMNKRTSVWP